MKGQLIPKFYRSAEEMETFETSTIVGTIPEWLCGTFIGCGPGKFDFEDFTVNHALDGYSILLKFEIRGNTVTMDKKYLQSDSYKRALAAQKPCVAEFGTKAYTDPSKGILSRIFHSVIPEMTDNSHMGIYNIGKEIYVAGDTGFFHEIDCCNLSVKSRNEGAKLFGVNMMCSHVLTDKDGFAYNVGISMLSGLKYKVVKIPPSTEKQTCKERLKNSEILCSIPTRSLTSFSLLHSFTMTENYIIFLEQAFFCSLTKVLGAVFSKGECFRDWVDWKPEMKNRFVIVEKKTGKVIKTEFISKDPFICLHFINAYEDQGQIVVDLFAFPNMTIIDSQKMEYYRAGTIVTDGLSRLERYIVPVNVDLKNCSESANLVQKALRTTATAFFNQKDNIVVLSPEIITELGDELPSINPNFQGRRYKYVYSTCGYIPNAKIHTVYKTNVETKEPLSWSGGEFSGCGEPLFVANPNGKVLDEDDGVVLLPVADSRDAQKDSIVILDAKNFKEMGRASFNASIPAGSHAIFQYATKGK